MDTQKIYCLDNMGIKTWKLKRPADSAISQENPTTDENWILLEHETKQCDACPLNKTRKTVVFGDGHPQADLMIIGEAPGVREDEQGKPFVGRAGMLLTEMLKAIGIDRNHIYITNILKCRPPNNRDPMPSEVECCTPFLKRQIDLMKPKLIVAIGRIAAHFLLNTKVNLGKLRGSLYEYSDIPLLVTYHPAYLLRSPGKKANAYEDLLRIQECLNKE